MERQNILKQAISRYGTAAQEAMAVEEMAELTKAICKSWRVSYAEDSTERQNVREEMADVQIMLDQLKIIYGPCEEIEEQKLIRLENKMMRTDEQEAQHAKESAP